MLIASSNAGRSSDLVALDLNFRQYTSGGVTFTIPGLTKTRRSGKPIQSTYSSFPDNSNICPVATLQHYETRTASHRSKDQGNNPLFLLYYKPFKAVGSATIGRWLRTLMQQAEVDIIAFKAHSTR